MHTTRYREALELHVTERRAVSPLLAKIAGVFDVTERTVYNWLRKKVRPIWGQRAEEPVSGPDA
jgi:hypothetical protein